jgi:RimJ/RimL family protein N-acetyltransferase
MKAPESIETERLLLRRPRHSDAQNIFRNYAGDPQVTRFLSWPTHASVADTWAFLDWSDREWEQWPAGPYLVFLRDESSRRVLGSVGLAFTSPEKAMAGYALSCEAWGKGFATEALSAVVSLARQLNLHELEAVCHADHAASARVLEKCGFQLQCRRERHTLFPNLEPGIRADTLLYALPLNRD